MGTSVMTLLLVVIAIAVVLLFLRSNDESTKKRLQNAAKQRARVDKPAAKSKNSWRATAIRCRNDACAAAKALENKRFLANGEAVPTLPLPDCDAASCGCTYLHHDDRRNADDLRRAPASLQTQLHAHDNKVERRTRRGRRATDFE